jgi:hypothetical protein
MISIFLNIIGYWIGLGIAVGLIMYLSLQFAIICEKFADLFKRN